MGHESDILDLVLTSAGKAAPYMTEKLCKIGDGRMSKGISALVDFATKYGIEIGEKIGLKKGIGLGVLGTLTVLGTVKVILDFNQNRIERIATLQNVDSQMKNDEVNAKFIQTNDESLSCDAGNELIDKSERG